MRRREFIVVLGAAYSVCARARAQTRPAETVAYDTEAPPPVNGSLSQVGATAGAGWFEIMPVSMDAVLHGPNTGVIFPFANSVEWNPITQCIRIVGMDHGDRTPPGGAWHVDYDDAGNNFVVRSRGEANTHCYQHCAVNPHTGDYWLYRQGAGFGMMKYDAALRDYAMVSSPPRSLANINTMAVTWWDGQVIGGGAQGAIVLLHMNTGGSVLIFDPLSSRWTVLEGMCPGVADTGVLQQVSAFSKRRQCLVYGGGLRFGGKAPTAKQVWRMDADGSKTRLTDAPVPMGEGLGNLVSDSRSGNILLSGSGRQWMLDPRGTGTWTQLATPPTSDPAKANPLLSCDTPYGVMYLSQYRNLGPARMHLFRS